MAEDPETAPEASPLARACAAVLAYDGIDPATLSEAALADHVLAVAELRSLAEARAWAAVRAFDARGGAAVDAAVSTRSWLRHRCQLTGADAGA
ncbi:MAG: hypothetical protein H0V33_08580, partial [Acidimicrobiia bacterium]|nr:hypothetical protein [Acidimicrobiia bacterium]